MRLTCLQAAPLAFEFIEGIACNRRMRGESGKIGSDDLSSLRLFSGGETLCHSATSVQAQERPVRFGQGCLRRVLLRQWTRHGFFGLSMAQRGIAARPDARLEASSVALAIFSGENGVRIDSHAPTVAALPDRLKGVACGSR